MFKGTEVWRLWRIAQTLWRAWARGRTLVVSAPEGRGRSCLTHRPGWVCCSCSFAKKKTSLGALTALSQSPAIVFLWCRDPKCLFRGKSCGYFSSGMLAKKKLYSDSFVVMSLRTKEVDSKSPNSRERRHGKPTLGDFHVSLVQGWSAGDTGAWPEREARQPVHGGTTEITRPPGL